MENNIAPPKKFTQEIKDNWIKALESGKHVQGFYALDKHETIDGIDVYTECCIGVLGNITPGINNKGIDTTCPYEFLESTIGKRISSNIVEVNDDPEWDKRDYSNVIPLIKTLPVQE